jgi:hypothetical protein
MCGSFAFERSNGSVDVSKGRKGMMAKCEQLLSVEQLIAYDLGELSAQAVEQVELHYFSCAECSERLSGLLDLRDAIRTVTHRGGVTVSVPARFVDSARARGLKVRRYELGPEQQVACTIAPEDDFVAICLKLGEADVAKVDVAVEWTTLDTQAREQSLVENVLFDRAAGQIVLLFSGAQVRSFPKSQWRMEARLSAPAETAAPVRSIGPYTLNHTPWEQLHSAS